MKRLASVAGLAVVLLLAGVARAQHEPAANAIVPAETNRDYCDYVRSELIVGHQNNAAKTAYLIALNDRLGTDPLNDMLLQECLDCLALADSTSQLAGRWFRLGDQELAAALTAYNPPNNDYATALTAGNAALASYANCLECLGGALELEVAVANMLNYVEARLLGN